MNHNVNLGLGINHPNQYFEESQKLLKGDIKVETKKEMSTIKMEMNDFDGVDFNEPLE